MSDCREKFAGDQTEATSSGNMDSSVYPKVEGIEDPENVVNDNSEDENEEPDKDIPEEEHKFYTNSEYANMKGDPSMSYEYSSGRPAAGYPTPHGPYNTEPTPKGRRHYKTADDTFDVGMNKSGNGSSGRNSRESTPEPGHQTRPAGVLYSNSEYAKMKGDPLMSYEYSSGRPAAGYPSTPQSHRSRESTPTPSRHVEMADGDTIDMERDKSGSCSPEPESTELIRDATHSGDIVSSEVTCYSNSEYAKMKGDPVMSYEYSSGRPAAGYPTPQNTHDAEISEDEKEDLDDDVVEPEGISYTNSEYAKMKGVPSMRYEYSSERPAAGQRPSTNGSFRNNDPTHSTRHHY